MTRLFHIGILAAAAAVAASTADAQGAGATKLDGRWTGSLTRAQILHATGSKSLAEKLHGSWTAQLGKGHFEFHDRDTGTDARGAFAVNRNRVRFVFATGLGLKKGQVAVFTWNVYRDRLTFKTVPGRPGVLIDLFVWTRAL
jgi:hypothetical protein